VTTAVNIVIAITIRRYELKSIKNFELVFFLLYQHISIKHFCVYLLHELGLLTAKHRLSRSVFTSKQVFGPLSVKSQPIWIKFCTHLLLYGIHLWADLDRDRRVCGSRPNQNDKFM